MDEAAKLPNGKDKAEATVLLDKASLHNIYKEWSESIKCMESALSYFAREMKDQPRNYLKAFKIQKSLSGIYVKEGEYAKAIKLLSNCIEISKLDDLNYLTTFELMWKKYRVLKQSKSDKCDEERRKILLEVMVSE